jgi:hypothetical protein
MGSGHYVWEWSLCMGSGHYVWGVVIMYGGGLVKWAEGKQKWLDLFSGLVCHLRS